MEIIRKLDSKRDRDFTKYWVPLYSGEIACGLFCIADDFVDQYLSLDEKFLKDRTSVFFIRASGDSMSPKIENNDILIVDTSLTITSGKIGAFFFNGNAICKKFVRENNKVYLESLNPKFEKIIINEDDELDVFGVVIGLVRDFF